MEAIPDIFSTEALTVSYAKTDLKTICSILCLLLYVFLQYSRMAARYDLPYNWDAFNFAKPALIQAWNKAFFSDSQSMAPLNYPELPSITAASK